METILNTLYKLNTMKAMELRIGNWVEYKGHYVIWDVSDFDDSTAKRLSQPIPLTEEWLLKFGFEWDTVTYYFGPLMCAKFPDGWTFWYKHFGEDHRALIPITHVHQLQNLYFALTGEELKLTASTA